MNVQLKGGELVIDDSTLKKLCAKGDWSAERDWKNTLWLSTSTLVSLKY